MHSKENSAPQSARRILTKPGYVHAKGEFDYAAVWDGVDPEMAVHMKVKWEYEFAHVQGGAIPLMHVQAVFAGTAATGANAGLALTIEPASAISTTDACRMAADPDLARHHVTGLLDQSECYKSMIKQLFNPHGETPAAHSDQP